MTTSEASYQILFYMLTTRSASQRSSSRLLKKEREKVGRQRSELLDFAVVLDKNSGNKKEAGCRSVRLTHLSLGSLVSPLQLVLLITHNGVDVFRSFGLE